MRTALKAISVLLCYPEEELMQALPEIRAALAADRSVGAGAREALVRLLDDLAALDLYGAQERYVHLFDRTRALSLHLFEHVHGESRERGQAMVDLKNFYEERGFEIDARELPDYLPLFLEFVSLLPEAEAKEWLGQIAHIAVGLKQRLAARGSAYASAFAALEAVAGVRPDRALLAEMMKQADDDPDDLETLDRVWEDEVVTFGGNAGEGACGPDRIARRVRAANRPAPDDAPNATH